MSSKIRTLYQRFTRNWSEQNKLIFNALVVLSVVTILVKVVAAVKDIATGYIFGVGEQTDVYFAAYQAVNVLVLSLTTSFSMAFIPNYVKFKHRNNLENTTNYVANFFMLTFFVAVFGTLLLIIVSHPLLKMVAPGFSAEKFEMVKHLFFTLLPFFALSIINTIFLTLLNAEKRFFAYAMIPVATPIIMLIFIFMAAKIWGIETLVYGQTLGIALEILITITLLKFYKIKLWPQKFQLIISQHVSQFFHSWWPLFLAIFTTVAVSFIDTSMTSLLPGNMVSALFYATKLVALPLLLAATVLSQAITPYLSKFDRHNDAEVIKETLRHYTKLLLWVTIPGTILMILLSPLFVKLIYYHGAFTLSDVNLVVGIFIFLVLMLPFYVLLSLNIRILISLMLNKWVLIIDFTKLLLSPILNWILMQYYGVYGIAASTTLCHIAAWLVSFYVIKNILNPKNAVSVIDSTEREIK